jgi:hypothetical protein
MRNQQFTGTRHSTLKIAMLKSLGAQFLGTSMTEIRLIHAERHQIPNDSE